MMSFVNTADLIGEDALVEAYLTNTLIEIRDDRILTLRKDAFRSSKLTKAILPNIDKVTNMSFSESKLEFLDVASAKTFEDYAVRSCPLKTVILRMSEVCSLLSMTGNDPLATADIYVPAALIDSYKSATNWSTYADRFRALEDYTVDGTVTGELDETKI